MKLLGPEGLNIPHVILTDRDPTNGNHPLVRRRLINVLDVIEGGVDHENLDADEVIELAEQYGYFVNENTLEPELFAGGLAQDMQEVIREELPRLRRETLNALQQWVDDPDQVDEDWLLRLIERIGKGRFAQALAPSVSQDVCPAYIRSALSISVTPSRSVSTAYLAQAAELAGNPGQLAAYNSQGHCVVLAGPGSGKTKTLVLKLARILAEDVEAPRGVACITYSQECARELARRIESLGLQQAPNLFIGTVHGFCLRHLLMPYGRLAGLPISFPLSVATNESVIGC